MDMCTHANVSMCTPVVKDVVSVHYSSYCKDSTLHVSACNGTVTITVVVLATGSKQASKHVYAPVVIQWLYNYTY